MPTYAIIEDRRGGGPNRSKLTFLSFGGCDHTEKLVVRGVILPSDYHNQERLIHFQKKVLSPMVREILKLMLEHELAHQKIVDAQ